MSDDLLRSARQFMAELDASEAYLRLIACQGLPFDRVLAMERRAGRRCAELLASFATTFDLGVGDDATDELLSVAVQPRRDTPSPRQSSDSQVLNPPVTAVPPLDPIDDGPEGVADEAVDLLSEEDEPTGHVEREAILAADEDTSDDDTSEVAAPLVASADGDVSWVTYQEGDESVPADVLKYDDSGLVTPDPVERMPAPAADVSTDDPFAGLVSFEDDSDDDGDDATLIMQRPPVVTATVADNEPTFGDVGQDALDTSGPDLDGLMGLDSMADSGELTGELEELELDLDLDLDTSVAVEVETFDLMPDLEDDEEATFHGLESREATEDEPSSSEVVIARGRKRASVSPSVPRSTTTASGVTAGLYGNPNVPTIREGKDPRPRAAAIQLKAGGGSKVLGLEEEAEPIAVGSAEDYGEVDPGGGFSVSLERHEDEYEDEYEDDEEDEEVIEPARPAEPPPPSAEELTALFRKAQDAAAGGDMQLGADLYSDVIDLEPDHVEAHVGRGRLYLDLGDYSRAMSDFMVAEEIEQSNPEPQIAIGDLYFARKDYRKAIDYFNAALEMSPNHAMAFCRRGISHYYRKNYKQALDDLMRAQKLNADIPNIQTYVSMAKKKARK